jgi:hypothetical protein
MRGDAGLRFCQHVAFNTDKPITSTASVPLKNKGVRKMGRPCFVIKCRTQNTAVSHYKNLTSASVVSLLFSSINQWPVFFRTTTVVSVATSFI